MVANSQTWTNDYPHYSTYHGSTFRCWDRPIVDGLRSATLGAVCYEIGTVADLTGNANNIIDDMPAMTILNIV